MLAFLVLASLFLAACGGPAGFPADFIWGVGTSAYQVMQNTPTEINANAQIEGAYNVGGRGFSIWDQWTHSRGAANGDVSCDHYHRVQEDVELMQQLGIRCASVCPCDCS